MATYSVTSTKHATLVAATVDTASTRRFGTAGTSLTALPASFTPSTTGAVTNQNFWVAAA
jgi:hypothetical protein